MIGFDRQAARDLTATFAIRVGIGRRRRSFGLRVQNGRLMRAAPSEAAATVTVAARDIVRLATGTVGWPQLLASGRLELAGDPFLALRFPGLFKMPSAPRRRRDLLRHAHDVDIAALKRAAGAVGARHAPAGILDPDQRDQAAEHG
jgi:hypothetical protein